MSDVSGYDRICWDIGWQACKKSDILHKPDNPRISDKGHKMDKALEIPMIGTVLVIPSYTKANKHNSDIAYEIISTVTYQEERGVFITICTCVALDANAELVEEIEPFTLNLDMYDFTVV